MADSRSSRDSIEWLLNSAQLPSSRERQVWAVEPPVIVMYRPAVPDPDETVGFLRSGQSADQIRTAHYALSAAALAKVRQITID